MNISLRTPGSFPHFKNLILFILAATLFCFTSCDQDTYEDTSISFYKENNLSITQYINSHPEQFSILSGILDTTGLDHLFKTYGDYTFFAPTDSAYKAYFKEIGINSYTDLDTEELTKLVRYHVFSTRILAGYFNMGIINTKTLSYEYIVSSPSLDGSYVFLNKQAKIISKDLNLPNGILHVIDKVLEQPKKTLYDWLKDNQSDYSIFLEAVEKTGLSKLLSEKDVEFTASESTIFYTGFITPDKKYYESNINSFSDLASFISPGKTNYTDSTNHLNSFIKSHFTTEVISMSDATEDQTLFGTLGGSTLRYGLKPLSASVVLNYRTSKFPEGLNIDEFNSNNLVANGIIHVMDTMFQLVESFEREKLCFLFLDVPGFPYDSIYNVGVELYEAGLFEEYHRYWPRLDGPKHIPFERTNGWLTLNAPYSAIIKFDHHRRSEWNTPQPGLYGQGQPGFLGFEACDDLLDITRKLPYIIPGKYKLFHYTKEGEGRPTVRHYFDGKPVGGMVSLITTREFKSLYLGVVEIKEGEAEHFFRVQMVTPGYGFYVAIKLEPVN